MKQYQSITVLGLVAFLLLGYNFMSAQWSAPTATAPNSNTPAPVNVGATTQVKNGNLAANIFAATTEMRSSRYCDALGNNCFTGSSSSGANGISSLAAGPGITLSPTTITSTGTISVNTTYTQRRVTGSCPVGQGIRQINADGTVVCQANAGTCMWQGQAYSEGATCRTGTSNTCSTGYARYSYQTCTAGGTWAPGSQCLSGNSPWPSCP